MSSINSQHDLQYSLPLSTLPPASRNPHWQQNSGCACTVSSMMTPSRMPDASPVMTMRALLPAGACCPAMAASADGDGFAGRGGGAFRPSAVAAVAAFAAAARAAGDGPGNGGGIAALRRHWLTVRGTVTVHSQLQGILRVASSWAGFGLV